MKDIFHTSVMWECSTGADVQRKRAAMWAGSPYRNLSIRAPAEIGGAGERIFKTTMHRYDRSCEKLKGVNGDFRVSNGPIVEVKFSLESLAGTWHWNHLNTKHYDGVPLVCLMGVTPTECFAWITSYSEAASHSDGRGNKGPMSIRVADLPDWLLSYGDGTFDAALLRLDEYMEAM